MFGSHMITANLHLLNCYVAREWALVRMIIRSFSFVLSICTMHMLCTMHMTVSSCRVWMFLFQYFRILPSYCIPSRLTSLSGPRSIASVRNSLDYLCFVKQADCRLRIADWNELSLRSRIQIYQYMMPLKLADGKNLEGGVLSASLCVLQNHIYKPITHHLLDGLRPLCHNWYQNNYTVIDHRLRLSIVIMNFEGKEDSYMAMIAVYHFFCV